MYSVTLGEIKYGEGASGEGGPSLGDKGLDNIMNIHIYMELLSARISGSMEWATK